MASTDLDLQALRRRLSGRVIGSRIVYHEVLGSTMDEAKRLASEVVGEGTVVVAEEQTAGKGRFDRSWTSPPGQNLTFSVVLRPTADQLRFVNMAATLAVSEAVSRLAGLRTAIKWPNDVNVGGRKLSGILIESSVGKGQLEYAVVGIGINVNFDPSRFPEVASTATSLYRETGRLHDRVKVMVAVLKQLDDLYAGVKSGASLTSRWSAQVETLGRAVKVRWRDRVIEGNARSVDNQGNLLVATGDGSIVTVMAGEVTLQA